MTLLNLLLKRQESTFKSAFPSSEVKTLQGRMNYNCNSSLESICVAREQGPEETLSGLGGVAAVLVLQMSGWWMVVFTYFMYQLNYMIKRFKNTPMMVMIWL